MYVVTSVMRGNLLGKTVRFFSCYSTYKGECLLIKKKNWPPCDILWITKEMSSKMLLDHYIIEAQQ